MKTTVFTLLPLLISNTLLAAESTDTENVPTENSSTTPNTAINMPACEYCPPLPSADSELAIELLYANDRNAQFGEYNGRHDDGVFTILAVQKNSWWQQGQFLQMDALLSDGLRHAIQVSGGSLQQFQWALSSQRLTHQLAAAAQTPFDGVGSAVLTLPDAWQRADTTTQMTALNEALQPLDVALNWRRQQLALHWQAPSDWSFASHVSQQQRDGLRLLGGSFLNRSTLLPMVVDERSREADFSARYRYADGWLSLAYTIADFTNAITQQQWQNPFTPIVAGADIGTLAAAPANRYQHWRLQTQWRAAANTVIDATGVWGQGRQDADFIAASSHPDLSVALPQNSLDGSVNTLHLQIKARIEMPADERLTLEGLRDKRDNTTARYAYTPVITDSYVGTTQRNPTWQYDRQRWRARLQWSIDEQQRLLAGYESEDTERQFADLATLTQKTTWLDYVWHDTQEWQLRLQRSRRDGAALEGDDDAVASPLLWSYQLSDREQKKARLRWWWPALETLTISAQADYAINDFPSNTVGREATREHGVSLAFDWSAESGQALNVYLGQQQLAIDQNGAATEQSALWQARSDDTVNSAGWNWHSAPLFEVWQIDLGADYQRSLHQLRVSTSSDADAFPDVISRYRRYQLQASRLVKNDWQLRLQFSRERLQLRDWASTELAPDTLIGILGIGAEDGEYAVREFSIHFSRRF